MDRREFLLRAGLITAAASLGGAAACSGDSDPSSSPTTTTTARAGKVPGRAADSVLEQGASDAPFDTVVVVMMENRSFDHLFGWVGTDEAYLDAGRRRYGDGFTIDVEQDLSYPDPDGTEIATHWLTESGADRYPYQGCGEGIPGHGWNVGRAQLRDGFLARGSGNDRGVFALGYYRGRDMPFFDQMVRRFTTGDRYFSSLLGPTFPNREYLYSAQSGGAKGDPGPLRPGMFPMPTIWDRLHDANVPLGYYYTDLPILPLWGDRFYDITRNVDAFYDDAANGRLANVVMVEPGFQIARRTDDHPVGDIRTGQRWLRSVFQAFAQSPHWERGVFVIVYDEWGGFFDHVRPPVVPDARASRVERDNFGQLGFRVPMVVASPYARPGFVDHTTYDHTSILRMLEWRFLGAPTEGPGRGSHGRWWLTDRDRHTNNLARALVRERDADLRFDVALELPDGAQPCDFGALGGSAHDGDPFQNTSQAMEDLQDSRFKSASESHWLRGS